MKKTLLTLLFFFWTITTLLSQYVKSDMRVDMLRFLWQKNADVYYGLHPLDCPVELFLTLPDSQTNVIMLNPRMYAAGFAAVYRSVVFMPQKIHCDSIMVGFFKSTDSLHPLFTGWVAFDDAHFNDKTAKLMTQAMMFLSPYAKYNFTCGDEFFEVYKLDKPGDPTRIDNIRLYSRIMAGMTEKYCWKQKSNIQKFVFVWLNDQDVPHTWVFRPKSKEFIQWLRNF